MARLKGFEPLTARFVAEYSIQLSYRRIILRMSLKGLFGLSCPHPFGVIRRMRGC